MSLSSPENAVNNRQRTDTGHVAEVSFNLCAGRMSARALGWASANSSSAFQFEHCQDHPRVAKVYELAKRWNLASLTRHPASPLVSAEGFSWAARNSYGTFYKFRKRNECTVRSARDGR